MLILTFLRMLLLRGPTVMRRRCLVRVKLGPVDRFGFGSPAPHRRLVKRLLVREVECVLDLGKTIEIDCSAVTMAS